MPSGTTPPYVIWSSLRHQDGRRPSGVGYNSSMIHIRSAPREDDYYALCGAEIVLHERTPSEKDLKARKICKRCQAAWDHGRRMSYRIHPKKP